MCDSFTSEPETTGEGHPVMPKPHKQDTPRGAGGWVGGWDRDSTGSWGDGMMSEHPSPRFHEETIPVAPASPLKNTVFHIVPELHL